MTTFRVLTTAAALSAMTATGLFATSPQPYAGDDAREIAGLSPQDIDDLLNGRGWGFALPAELNGFPGPTHVLELADDLGLTPEQAARIEGIRARMEAEARNLGAAYVAAEAALDAAFADGTIDADRLRALTVEAAAIEADLRRTHLAAHLEITPLLTRHQIVTYNRLRGYGNAASGAHSGHGGH